MNRKIPLRVLFVTPDLFGPPGGIARFSRLCCKALLDATEVEFVDVIALNDQPPQIDNFILASEKATYCATARNKAFFVQKLLRRSLAGRHYNMLFTTHVNLTPTLWPLHFMAGGASAFVGVAHGIDVWDRLPWLRRIALRKTSRILSVSQVTKDRMTQANSIRSEQVRILHNCLDPNLMGDTLLEVGPTTPSCCLQSPSILTVSRLSIHDRYKGHTQVLEALAEIRRRGFSVHYYIVGEGELRAELQQRCEIFGLSHTVHFLGQVDEATLQLLYRHADLFVMPSRGEGFGLVYLEAMACGTPVIAGNQDAAVEVVQHGETGLLVAPDDTAELVEGIIQLLTADELRSQMGRAGQRIATTKFGYEQFRETLLSYLHEALSTSTDERIRK